MTFIYLQRRRQVWCPAPRRTPNAVRVWVADPGPTVNAVTDRDGRCWRRVADGRGGSLWRHDDPEGPWLLTWGELLDHHQPLTSA